MEEKPSILRALFKKYHEIIMYVIFGLVTTGVSWLVYSVCVAAFRSSDAIYIITITALEDVETVILHTEFYLYILYANIVSWIISVSVAFVTNKLWVFDSRSWKPRLVTREALTFIGGRVFTGIIEIIAVPLLFSAGLSQTLFNVEGLPAKMIVSIVIVILNYILSKFFSFRTREKV